MFGRRRLKDSWWTSILWVRISKRSDNFRAEAANAEEKNTPLKSARFESMRAFFENVSFCYARSSGGGGHTEVGNVPMEWQRFESVYGSGKGFENAIAVLACTGSSIMMMKSVTAKGYDACTKCLRDRWVIVVIVMLHVRSGKSVSAFDITDSMLCDTLTGSHNSARSRLNAVRKLRAIFRNRSWIHDISILQVYEKWGGVVWWKPRPHHRSIRSRKKEITIHGGKSERLLVH